MIKSPYIRRTWMITSIILSVFALDQVSKYWLLYKVGMATRPPIALCDYFSLVMAWNTGVSFSLFAHGAPFMRWLLVGMALLVSALLLRLALVSEKRSERVGYAMVIGGALGNALDRVRFGAVADFFYAHIGDIGWPAFNVADMAICAGVGLLLLSMFKRP
jgi:signal peptidase II